MIKNFIFIGCVITAYFLGYNHSSNGYKALIAQLEAKNINKVLEIEHKKAKHFTLIENEGADEKAFINSNYSNALNELNGLHNERKAYSVQMSENDRITERPTRECRGKSHHENTKHFKELLDIAKDCDIIAEKYNRLLKLYKLNQENID